MVHSRVFEADPSTGDDAPGTPAAPPPVVILGEFGDHVGRLISNSIADAAAAAQARFYADGQLMRVVLMYPNAVHCLTHPLTAPLLLREAHTVGSGPGGRGLSKAPPQRLSHLS